MANEDGDNCASCGFNRDNDGTWSSTSLESKTTGHCTIRMIEVSNVHRTTCANRHSRVGDPEGPAYSLDNGGRRVPWFGKVAPETDLKATCVVCQARSTSGIAVQLVADRLEFCDLGHYSSWREARLASQMRHLEEEAEKSYSEMYETSSTSGYYSEVKECYHASIQIADELGLMDKAEEMRKRLEHIKEVVRRQF